MFSRRRLFLNVSLAMIFLPISFPAQPIFQAKAAQSASRNVVVFLQGVCSSMNPGYATDDKLFALLRSTLMHPYGYNSSQFLEYSYAGGYMEKEKGVWVWQHNGYKTTTPISQDYQTTSWSTLDSMLTDYNEKYPGTKFTLVGHSLGGVVAFEELIKQKGMYNSLAGVVTVDSPLHGITLAVETDSTLLAGWGIRACAIDGPASSELAGEHQSNPAILRRVVATAHAHHIQVVTTGNLHDGLLQPTECAIPVKGDINTQWVGGATILKFSLKKPWTLPGDCVGQTHSAALSDSDTYAALAKVIAGTATPASAPASITEYPIPTTASFPTAITMGSDGNLWFLESYGNKVGRISPNSVITEFLIPSAADVTPCGGCTMVSSSFPSSLINGKNGNLWFFENSTDKIARISERGVITEFPIPSHLRLSGILSWGPDDNLWLVSSSGGSILRVTPQGRITSFSVPTTAAVNGILSSLTTGPDGNLWFAEANSYYNQTNPDMIGRITPGGEISEFLLPDANAQPGTLTVGSDGALWFTELGIGKIGRITSDGKITRYSLPYSISQLQLDNVVSGPDGNLWLIERINYTRYLIARMTTTGNITEYPFFMADSQSQASGLIAGRDGNLWFTTHPYYTPAGGVVGSENSIVRVTPTGSITKFSLPSAHGDPFYVTSGSDDSLWFTEYGGNKIGRILS